MTEIGSVEWNIREVDTGCGTVHYRTAGDGPVLVYLPRDNGYPQNHPFLDSLTQNWRVIAPWYPGFHGGKDEDWTWLEDVRDLALVTSAAISRLSISSAVLLGMGFGGWVGATMLCARPDPFKKAVLVSPMGIRPSRGVIYDQFLVGSEIYARKGVRDQAKFDEAFASVPAYEQLEAWEDDREMTCRLAWKPYMHQLALPRLLRSVAMEVTVAHGANDDIVPREASEMYCDALSMSRLEVLPDCGHAADLEQPQRLSKLLTD